MAAATTASGCMNKSDHAITSANASQPIWLDEVKCIGQEESLAECQRSNWGATNCGHKEDAGCMCEAADSSTSSTLAVPVDRPSRGPTQHTDHDDSGQF